ncbi:DUF1289 domain-containing protein [Prosthecodimorpha hirschii]|uniref:DUF1289 domain-containing protein n=1 Tax=Prosthecodimorpha hirschii TaxID=665126 RepID=UPI001FEFE5A4|nr:DUF1289 domain-containing protein [Prosthecomicrobium hirschii]
MGADFEMTALSAIIAGRDRCDRAVPSPREPASTMPQSAAILSPCVKVCRIEPGGDVCLGCERTLAEIAGWGLFTNAERAAIMAALPARRSVRRDGGTAA